ncbi:hypothetical protein FQR65_LT14737 [Abscondita terminalis]|nr:hypothetical protein FQR65_LT14737 [Abscondita terminalis]
MSRLLEPDQGSIHVLGQSVTELGVKENASNSFERRLSFFRTVRHMIVMTYGRTWNPISNEIEKKPTRARFNAEVEDVLEGWAYLKGINQMPSEFVRRAAEAYRIATYPDLRRGY